MNIVYVLADKPLELNTSIWRCLIPARALARAGNTVATIPFSLFAQNDQSSIDACMKAEIIVVERNFIFDTLTAAMFFKVRGKVIIANFDDAYQKIEASNASFNYWGRGKANFHDPETNENREVDVFPHPMEQFVWGLKTAHAATLPSKELCKYWKNIIPTYYLPNYFETERYINIPKTPRPFITLGWGGSISHFQSWMDSGIIDALKNVFILRPNVHLLICGDKNVFNKFDFIENNRKEFIQFVPYEEWGRLVAEKFDIGLAPLAGEYDHYRSWIKPMEYSLTKTPWLASDGPAYHEYKKLGHLVQNNLKSWEAELLRVIDNLEVEKQKIAGEPYQFALAQDIDKNVDNIINMFVEIAKKHAKVEFKQVEQEKKIEVPKLEYEKIVIDTGGIDIDKSTII